MAYFVTSIPVDDDVSQCYAKHHPQLPVDSPIPTVCSECACRYSLGDLVVLCSQPKRAVFRVVGLIASSGNPDLVIVRHPEGHPLTYAKTQICLRPASPDGPKNGGQTRWIFLIKQATNPVFQGLHQAGKMTREIILNSRPNSYLVNLGGVV